LTRLSNLIAIATLAAAVLFRSSTNYRMTIGIVVSLAAVVLVVRGLFTGKVVIAAIFLGVLGVFTPFRNSPSSQVLISIFDLATLALFAASPIMLRKTAIPTVSRRPQG
jgi:uncharacterized membrane protein